MYDNYMVCIRGSSVSRDARFSSQTGASQHLIAGLSGVCTCHWHSPLLVPMMASSECPSARAFNNSQPPREARRLARCARRPVQKCSSAREAGVARRRELGSTTTLSVLLRLVYVVSSSIQYLVQSGRQSLGLGDLWPGPPHRRDVELR